MTSGFVQAGISYAGLATPPTSPDNPGASPGAAFIDQNGDYQVDGKGDVVKTSYHGSRALCLIRTTLGSALDKSLGLTMPTNIDASWENRMRNSVERALSPMTDDGSIRIDQIEITRPLPHRASVFVHYTVLASGQTEIAKVY